MYIYIYIAFYVNPNIDLSGADRTQDGSLKEWEAGTEAAEGPSSRHLTHLGMPGPGPNIRKPRV